MNPADWPRDERDEDRLLVVDVVTRRLSHRTFRDFASEVAAGDVVVVNDAATLPSVLPFVVRGEAGELRIAAIDAAASARAILFGRAPRPRAPTEDYAPPPHVGLGDVLDVGDARATVEDVDAAHPRLVRVQFDRPLADVAYRIGRPIQYAHVRAPLRLYDVQTAFATRPWAVEMPSAARPLKVDTLQKLRGGGAVVVALTHGAGLSSTGDPTLDARLPLRERYDIPKVTAAAIARARARGGRVVAIGTSVVRALESSAADHAGEVVAGEGTTDRRVDRRHPPAVVDAVLSGMHRPGTSHFDLLEGFTDASVSTGLTLRAFEEAEARGYLEHEFGDSVFIVGRASARVDRAA